MVFNNLNFAGVNSIDYGIYITGEAVYNVPERSVEFVSIAGRDGDLILDNGHFENIEVTYPAGCFGEDQTSFADKVRAFRNAIASKKGYQRLTDSYNPNEYRLATFVNGVEVDPTSYGRAGEFELVFNCQPFRYLMSGESEIEVTSGDEIANPTLFESKPLIEVEGYGTLNVGDYEIELENAVMGEVDIVSGTQFDDTIYLNSSLYNTGDTITTTFTPRYEFSYDGEYADSFTVLSSNGVEGIKTQGIVLYVTFSATFTGGTSATSTPYVRLRASISGTLISDEVQINPEIRYYPSQQSIALFSRTPSESDFTAYNMVGTTMTATADSSVVMLGHPTYIDCDIGQAYKLVDGEPYSLDAYIDLGSDLPVLDAGENEITYDNTITSVKIIPRWRQI